MIPAPTHIRRHLTTGLFAASLILIATGCATAAEPTPAAPSTSVEQTEAPSPTPEATQPTESATALTLQTVTNDQGNYAVLATGTSAASTETLSEKLITADHGCFHATARDAAPTLLLFPEGTSITSNGKPSVVVGGANYAVGSRLTFSGTTVTLSSENLLEAAPCEPHGAVFLVSSVTN